MCFCILMAFRAPAVKQQFLPADIPVHQSRCVFFFFFFSKTRGMGKYGTYWAQIGSCFHTVHRWCSLVSLHKYTAIRGLYQTKNHCAPLTAKSQVSSAQRHPKASLYVFCKHQGLIPCYSFGICLLLCDFWGKASSSVDLVLVLRFSFECVWVFLLHHMCAVLTEVRRGCRVLQS